MLNGAKIFFMEKIFPKVQYLLKSKTLLRAEIACLIFLGLLTLSIVAVSNYGVLASVKQSPKAINKNVTISKTQDTRVEILEAYLASKRSPMKSSAKDFIEAADTYGVDWKLVPSIAGVESTFGKFIPGGYNGWGWGVYGTQAIYFNSWRDGIFTVTGGLKKNYIDKGLNTPSEMNRVYAASKTWGNKVNFFMNDLEKYEKQYKLQALQTVDQNTMEIEIAGKSGTLSGS